MLAGAFLGSGALTEFIDDNPGAPAAFANSLLEHPAQIRLILLALGAVLTLLGVAALIRKPGTLKIVRGGFFALYALMLVYTFFVVQVTLRVQGAHIKVDGEDLQGVNLVSWLVSFYWFVFPLAMIAGITQLYSLRSVIDQAYGRDSEELPTKGDRIFETIWSRRVRSYVYSATVHGLFLLLPFLLALINQKVEAYSVPFGKGLADAGGGGKKAPPPKPPAAKKPAGRKTVKVSTRDPKKLKGVIFSPSAGRENSTEMKDAALAADILKETTQQYSAASRLGEGTGVGPCTKAGKIGAGGVGEGGYPWGKKGAIIRFIRLQYDGEGWDDGMDDSRADLNFLDFFHEVVGFKVSTKTEAIGMHTLKAFRKGEAPPFVFMKGESHIGTAPPGDIATLRAYLLSGGMVFADAGCLSWGQDFERFIARVLPDVPLIEIPDDDPIFKVPYTFPNGAPQMWHHAGTRAKGCKYQGRWCVFYHPGDVSDAWKNGHDGLTQDKADVAFQIGLNVVLYSFNHYYELNKP